MENSEIQKLPLKRLGGIVANLLVPENDEPIAVYYIKSGWDHGYPMYHVIIEYGDFEQTDYLYMSEEDLCKRFDVTPELLNEKVSISVSQKDLRDYPNDQDLGRSIRKQFI